MAYPDICPSGTKDKGPNDQLCDVESGPYGDTDLKSADHVLQGGEYQGHEAGSCDANETKYYARLLQEHPLTPQEATNVEGYFGVLPGSGQFILDANTRKAGVGCIWVKDKAQMAEQILDLKENTEKCEALFTSNQEQKCEALKKTMVAGYEHHFKDAAPKTTGEQRWEKIETAAIYGLTGVVGVAATFGVAVPWLQKWFGPKGPGDPPSGGSGTSDVKPATEQTTTLTAAAGASGTLAAMGSFLSENAKAIGWGLVGVGAALATAALVLDDATGIGVADDPLLLITAPATAGAFAAAGLAFSRAWGESPSPEGA